jgi:hypothetical protein
MSNRIPETPDTFDDTRLIERPDGFYWQSTNDGREYGPFETLLAAVQDMQQSEESFFEPGETPEEAKAELGIADWIDPDTGEPAEEDGPRTEEH